MGHRSTTVLMNITWWVEHGLYIMWVFVLGHDSNFTANYVSSSFIHENLITLYIYIMASRGKTLVLGQDFSLGTTICPELWCYVYYVQSLVETMVLLKNEDVLPQCKQVYRNHNRFKKNVQRTVLTEQQLHVYQSVDRVCVTTEPMKQTYDLIIGCDLHWNWRVSWIPRLHDHPG
jgi:hypothetical protein